MRNKDLDSLVEELFARIEESEEPETTVTNNSSGDGYFTVKLDKTYSASSNSTWSPNTTTGGIWTTTPNTTQSGSTTGGNWSSGTWTTITYPDALGADEEAWPKVEDALGVIFIDGDEIKLKTKNGKEVTIARLDDSDDFIPIEVIAAKKKLIEEASDQETV